jgi:hypothetical protein
LYRGYFVEVGRRSYRGGVFILFFGVILMFKLSEYLSDKDIKKLKSIKKKPKKKPKKKRKEKLSRRDLIDLMGMNRPTYKRVRGAIRRK